MNISIGLERPEALNSRETYACAAMLTGNSSVLERHQHVEGGQGRLARKEHKCERLDSRELNDQQHLLVSGHKLGRGATRQRFILIITHCEDPQRRREEQPAPECHEPTQRCEAVCVEGEEANISHEEAKRLTDRIARGAQLLIPLGEDREGQPVDGDVLCGGERVEEKEETATAADRPEQPVDVPARCEEEQPDKRLCGDNPRLAPAKLGHVDRVDKRRPQQLEREGVGDCRESGLFHRGDPPLLEEHGERAGEAERNALERVEQQEESDCRQVRADACRLGGVLGLICRLCGQQRRNLDVCMAWRTAACGRCAR
eukprot:scaffold308789_cov27-Tisochrysis_lutea.AAC.1